MNIIFAGTPEFAVPPLLELSKNHNIVGVFTQPDRRSGRGKKLTPSPVKLKAEEIGVEVYQPHSLKDQQELISSLKPDVMIVVAYGMLLPQPILDTPKLGCINIHASLLPRWRGAAPIHRALQAGDEETGVSIMAMELGLDTGPVYKTLRTTIGPNDTSATVHDRLAQLGAQGIVETLDLLESNPDFEPVQQDDAKATYAKKLSKSEGLIDWCSSSHDINLKVRAFIPFPICFTYHNGTRIRVLATSIQAVGETADPGTVLAIDSNGPLISCGSGAVVLTRMQRDGSREMNWQDFKNGYELHVGDILGTQDGEKA